MEKFSNFSLQLAVLVVARKVVSLNEAKNIYRETNSTLFKRIKVIFTPLNAVLTCYLNLFLVILF